MDELRFHPVLRRFPGVLAAILPDMTTVRQWVEQATTLSEASLEQEIARRQQLLGLISHGRGEQVEGLEELERLLLWSKRVNELAGPALEEVSPFKGAVNFLKMLRPYPDQTDIAMSVIVVSQSVGSLLHSQWEQSGLHRHVDRIHGQEDGSKANLLKRYVRDGGFSGQMLVIGDAPGDLEAAQTMGAAFFPILPRHENESWERLAYEAWPIFATGNYTNDYQSRLVNSFFQCLSDARRDDQEQQKLPKQVNRASLKKIS
jgi:phosphoglycolate phosphatase-like HAD superfamily hydrolase